MAHSYPIWHEVKACHYRSGKSYGGKENSGETIYVGTSANNSHAHCSILTTKREDSKGNKIFKTSIDGVVLVETTVYKNGNSKKRTKLNKIKSL